MQLINMNAQQQLASKDAMIQSIQGMIICLFVVLDKISSSPLNKSTSNTFSLTFLGCRANQYVEVQV